MNALITLVLIAVGVIFAPSAYAIDTLPASSEFEACRSGQVRGGGYNPSTGKYAFTCGNYNWSAEIGGVDSNGVSKFGSPTTPGGNSWIMTCLGDGRGDKGTTYEQGVCLAAGETVRMYSMADIQLAVEMAEYGTGVIYLPKGLYHDAYCGQSPRQVANGCPVMASDPTLQIRKWTVWGGRKLIGEGSDRNGPLSGGRSGTYLISDHGADSASDGFSNDWAGGSTEFKRISCGSAGVGCGYESGHWAWQVGRKGQVSVCAWPSGAKGCDTDAANAILARDFLARSLIGRGSENTSILADIFPAAADASTPSSVCVNNALASSGVCSGNTKVQCTDNGETRSGENSGGCPDSENLGSCIGYADAIELELNRNTDPYLVAGITALAKAKYAGTSTTTEQATTLSADTSKFYYSLITSVGSVCSTTGRSVNLGSISSTQLQTTIGEFPHYDTASQPNTFYVMELDKVDNSNGGVFNVSVLPAQWWGRVGGTSAASCSTTESGATCDELEKLNLGGDWWGQWSNVASWYGGSGNTAGFGFSEHDGDPANLWGSLNNALLAAGRGLINDGSGWDFIENTILQWDSSTGNPLLKLNYSPGARTRGIKVFNSIGNALFTTQFAGSQIVEDIQVVGSEFSLGMISTRGGQSFSVRNITGWGNMGPVVAISSTNGNPDVWNISIRDVFLSNHRITSTSNPGVIQLTDYNGIFPGGKFGGFIDIQNVAVEMFGGQNSTLDELCAVVVDGGIGSDASAATGSGRTVDDWRNVLSLSNIDVSYVTDTVPVAGAAHFCFGNTTSGQAMPTVAATTNPWAAKGPMFSWVNLKLNNVPYPDNPLRSITAAQAGNCGVAVPAGTQVLVHNLDGLDCSETAGVLDADANDATNELGYCNCLTSGAWGAP